MATTLAPACAPKPSGSDNKPIRLKTREEAREYLAKHLKPMGHNPKGHSIYAQEDINKLTIILPEDD